MPKSLVNRGAQAQRLRKAGDADRDPADLQPPPEDTTTAPPARDEPPGRDDKPTANEKPKVKTTQSTGGDQPPSRRRGRPRGPDRRPLTVRVRAEVDERLTRAVDETGHGPQELVEQGLELLFRRLDRRRGSTGKHR
jgi:hypothetical protein